MGFDLDSDLELGSRGHNGSHHSGQKRHHDTATLSGAPQTMVHPSKRQRLSLVGGGGDVFTLPKRSQMFPALNPTLSPEDGNLLLGQSLVAAYIATMQDLTQEEQSQHTRRLTDAAEQLKKKKNSKFIRCGTSQGKAQAAALQGGRKKMGPGGDAGNQTADLASHSLWSRKYQPSNMSEVLGNGAVCEQLHEWLASWKRTASKGVAAQPAEQEQSPGSGFSPQNRQRGDSQDGNWSEVTLA